jgi:thiamine-monophosphate kinase
MNEIEVIRIITNTVLGKDRAKDIIGDDVAVTGANANLVIKTDMLVSTTDMPPQMTLEQASRKAVAMCVSDFAAKGVKPTCFLVSLGIPKGYTKNEIRRIALGLKKASYEWGLELLGGDTNLSKELVISCTMVGFSDKVVGRRGAKPAEIVVTNGYFGYTASGLKILLDNAKCGSKFKKKAVESVLKPSPRLEDGIILSKYLTSSIDSSDGLAISLHTLAELNGVGIKVTKMPVDNDVLNFASANGIKAEELVLFGGEEYLIVGTMRRDDFDRAKAELENRGGTIIAIGQTTNKKGVVMEINGSTKIPKKGWIYSF